jgi:hypothetical protein
MLGILTTRRRTFLRKSSKFRKNMNVDFFRDLEPLRRRHQVRRDWRVEKGRERDKFKNMDHRFTTKKMFPLNPINK